MNLRGDPEQVVVDVATQSFGDGVVGAAARPGFVPLYTHIKIQYMCSTCAQSEKAYLYAYVLYTRRKEKQCRVITETMVLKRESH